MHVEPEFIIKSNVTLSSVGTSIKYDNKELVFTLQ